MNSTLKILVIYGSNRENRLCDTIGSWLMKQLSNIASIALDLVDPATLDLPPRHVTEEGPVIRDFRRRVGAADGYIILTPEYNHSFPAVLKFLLDSAYEEWGRKAVGFISYGGIAGGVRAVEQLRQVVAELSIFGVRKSISLANPWDAIDEFGVFHSSAEANDALKAMMEDLVWWCSTLKTPRHALMVRTGTE